MGCSGFHQVLQGQDIGAFYNPIFLRDQPELFLQVTKTGSPPLRIKLPDSFDIGEPDSVKSNQEKIKASQEAEEQVKTILMVREYEPSCREEAASSKSSCVDSAERSVTLIDFEDTEGKEHRVADQGGVDSAVTHDRQKSLQKRDEQEVMRAARAMLYENFMQALKAAAWYARDCLSLTLSKRTGALKFQLIVLLLRAVNGGNNDEDMQIETFLVICNN